MSSIFHDAHSLLGMKLARDDGGPGRWGAATLLIRRRAAELIAHKGKGTLGAREHFHFRSTP